MRFDTVVPALFFFGMTAACATPGSGAAGSRLDLGARTPAVAEASLERQNDTPPDVRARRGDLPSPSLSPSPSPSSTVKRAPTPPSSRVAGAAFGSSAKGAVVGTRPGPFASALAIEGPRAPDGAAEPEPADVSGIWIWEHRAPIPTGDEKQEREEWHLEQRGDRISGYYDRVVKEISTDGHAFQCSRDLEFEIATRYRIRGEVRGDQVLIFESSFEVLDPSACDNGQRRLDAYEGQANGDEVRLAFGVGTQILRRPRPDVPTQHF